MIHSSICINWLKLQPYGGSMYDRICLMFWRTVFLFADHVPRSHTLMDAFHTQQFICLIQFVARALEPMGVRSIYGCVGCFFEQRMLWICVGMKKKQKTKWNKTSEDKQCKILNKLSANATAGHTLRSFESAKSIHFRLKVDSWHSLFIALELLTFSMQFKLCSGHNWSSFN